MKLRLPFVFLLFASLLLATPPAWWAERGVLTTGAVADDYAVVNQGQLKNIAKKAYEEFKSKLPGGAGATLTAIWKEPTAGTDDFVAMNIGQVKNVAKPFYDRLAEVGYTGQPLTTGQLYPWSGGSGVVDDYALSNIGQVKNVFSLDPVLLDGDHNGLIDSWEIGYFGHTGVDLDADPDGDGLTNTQEYAAGIDPTKLDSNGNGVSDGWLVANGFNPATHDTSLDTDGDGLSDAEEAVRGTNPRSADTDGDGVPDAEDGWPRDAALKQAPLPEVRYAVLRLKNLGVTEDMNVDEIDDAGNVLAWTWTDSYGSYYGDHTHLYFWSASTHTATQVPFFYDSAGTIDFGGGEDQNNQDPLSVSMEWDNLTPDGRVLGAIINEQQKLRAASWTPAGGVQTHDTIPPIDPDDLFSYSYITSGNQAGVSIGLEFGMGRDYDEEIGYSIVTSYYYRGGVIYPNGATVPSFLSGSVAATVPEAGAATLSQPSYFEPTRINDGGVIIGLLRGATVNNHSINFQSATAGAVFEANQLHSFGAGIRPKTITSEANPIVLGYHSTGGTGLWRAVKTESAWSEGPLSLWDSQTQTERTFSYSDSYFTASNDRLEIVCEGQIARNGVIHLLTDLMPSGWIDVRTKDINNHGVILAEAFPALDDQGLPITNPPSEPVLLVPVELTISRPVVESTEPIEYVVNADIASVELTASVLPAADGTVVAWEIEAGSDAGSLSHAESLTTNGFAKTTLTTSTAVGATYRVKARVKKFILPTSVANPTPVEFDFDSIGYSGAPHLQQTTDEIKVIPGFVASITTTRETLTGGPATSLPADGKSQLKLIATFKDAFGQPVAENTPVNWHLAGLGSIAPIDEVTDANGKARATLTSGDVAADQKVTIEADAFDVLETITNAVVTGTLAAASPSLDLATNDTTTLTISVPTAINDTPVRWVTSMGEIVNAAATVQNGQATATLRATGGRTGNALVTASVGGSIYSLPVAFTSSAPISIEVDNPVIVGDASTAGAQDVPRLNGTTQSVSYPTSATVRIKAPAYPGYTATVRFGEAKPLKTIRYHFDQITGVTTLDESGDHPATVSGASLDTVNHHDGDASLLFDDPAAVVGIPHHADLNLQAGMAISIWARVSTAHGTLVAKSGEYELALDTNGRVTFTVITSTGTHTVTGAAMPISRWVNVRGEYTATGLLKLTVDGAIATAATTGTPTTGTAQVIVGEDYDGWLDALIFDIGRQFVLGTGLSVGGLSGSNQVVLDANGEAIVTLASNGGTTVDAANPVFRAGMQVSINPQFEAEESVIVTTKQAYAVLDATLGDVRIQSGSTTAPLTERQKSELIAASLRELRKTGQRSAALLLEPSGTLTERQQYGFRAALWLETVDGAEKAKLVMENVDRLNLTSEQQVQLQEQVIRMLLDAIKSKSDSAAGAELINAHGGLIATLASLSTKPSFSAFTQTIDGRTIFVDLADLHEMHGPEVIDEVARLAELEAPRDPTFMQGVVAKLKRFFAPTTLLMNFTPIVVQYTEDHLRERTMQAIADGKITEVEGYAIGFGWGLAKTGLENAQFMDPVAAKRMAQQITATVIAASQGNQEARDSLKKMIPLWGLKVMNDEANDLAENGQYFDAGIKSAEVSVGSVGSVVSAGAIIKSSLAAGLVKAVVKSKKGGPPPLPASFGRSLHPNPSRTTFAADVRAAYSQYFPPHAAPPAPRMHHAVPVTTVEALSHKLTGSPISMQEMHSLSNARLIPHDLRMPDGRRLHQHITNKWAAWFEDHPTFTKEQLLDHATHIDDIYGHLFTIKVR